MWSATGHELPSKKTLSPRLPRLAYDRSPALDPWEVAQERNSPNAVPCMAPAVVGAIYIIYKLLPTGRKHHLAECVHGDCVSVPRIPSGLSDDWDFEFQHGSQGSQCEWDYMSCIDRRTCVHHVTNTVTFLHLYFGQGMSDENCGLLAQAHP
jgi:hypothetical protein